jgi:hypothetical protein
LKLFELRHIDVGRNNLRPFARKCYGACPPDPLSSSRDQCLLSLQPPSHSVLQSIFLIGLASRQKAQVSTRSIAVPSSKKLNINLKVCQIALLIPMYGLLLLLFFAYCYPIARWTQALERRFAVVN